MLTAQTLYRTTLVAAALAAASLLAPSAASAHERGWREHAGERYWAPVAAHSGSGRGTPCRTGRGGQRAGCAPMRDYRPVLLTAPPARPGLELPGLQVRATL